MEFVLRDWQVADAESLAKQANNPRIANNLRNIFPHPYTLADAEWYINDCMKADQKKQCIKAIVVDGKAVGSIGIIIKTDVACKSAELGYWLGEDFWGQRIITRAIRQMCDLAFAEYELVRIFAEPYAYNIGSQKALENAGFKLEGRLQKSIYKNGNFFDSYIYGLVE
ncbi:MAG: GNAT family protein [Clostridia bacterium]